MPQRLEEKLSFDQLFRISDPKRVARSFKVRGPPLDIDSYRDAVYYIFNFKSNPSTTGLRHKGYVKFLRPKNPKRTPLQKLDCIVDCTCPDYRYRWAWANKQRGASVVGGRSLNQALNRAPKKTNPSGIPGLCKHILATREYIYGLLSSFPGDEPDTADKLEKLTRYATKRWANYKDLVDQAKERERELQRQIQQRRLTGKPFVPPEVEKVKLEPPKPAAPAKPAAPTTPPRPFLKTGGAVPPEPTAGPPVEGPEPGTKRMFLKGEQPYTQKQGPAPKPAGPEPAPRKQAAFLRQQLPRRKREESQIAEIANSLVESVVSPNAELNMTTLTEATKLVEEMMDDDALTDLGPAGAGAMDTAPTDDMEMGLEPSEPPVSDSAIGADTEAETALGLLRQMRDLLAELVVGETGEHEAMGMEMPGGAEAVPGAEGGMPEMPGEPPIDEEVPVESGEGETEEHESGEKGEKEKGEVPGEGGSEEQEEEKRRNRRPSAD